MKQRFFALLLLAVLALGLAMPALAATEQAGFQSQYDRVLDMAELLTEAERTALCDTLDAISTAQQMDVVIATVDALHGYDIAAYADDLYDTCDFGYGSRRDGVLLLISIADGEWYISTCGGAISAFTDAGIAYIGEQIQPALSDGDFAEAFEAFATLCDDFLSRAREGEPYDSGNLPREPLSLIWIPISLGIGLLLALLVVAGMRGQLKTVRAQASAGSYVQRGSLHLTENRDLFLYHTVTRTARPKNNSSSGGSSTHSASSGRTHGGGGGRF